jgi:Domain of unknown function (DUF4249)
MTEKTIHIFSLHANMIQSLCCLLILLTAGCKQRYDSPVHSPVTGYLVIDGFISNDPAATSTIKLSRSAKLDSTNIEFERGALVKLEGQDNSFYTLLETDSGHYNISNLVLNNIVKYRIDITTSDGKQFLSEFEEVKSTPPIDSIGWMRESDGVRIYVNTHNDFDSVGYYQWEYDETWEFHAVYKSVVKYDIQYDPMNRPIYSAVGRYDSPPVYYTCWQSDKSESVIIGSSAKLSKDAIDLPVIFIDQPSWKLSVLYSIKVKQYSITKGRYEFLQRLKKNTEQLGSIFDSQPSELTTNLHCVNDPGQIVIGYFNICTVQEKRLYIDNNQLPNWGYEQGCGYITIDNKSDSILKYGLGMIPTYVEKGSLFTGIVTFDAAPEICVDCEVRGTHIKPDFWP